MRRVGIVSENIDNDAKPFKTLLEKKFDRKKATFIPILKNIKGDHLERDKTIKILKGIIQKEKLDIVLLLRDLDALANDNKKIELKKEWANKVDRAIQIESLFFLVIYELEALILCNPDCINAMYKPNKKINFNQNPIFQNEPKEYLKRATEKSRKGKYKESDAIDIFEHEKFHFENVYEKHQHRTHPCFSKFIDDLEAIL